MAVSKKFLEAVSTDEALKAKVEQAALEALGEFLKSKGLEAEAAKVTEEAMTKAAEAHGFKAEEMEEVSTNELEAVAGGWCACSFGGTGTGNGKKCLCLMGGRGEAYDGHSCICPNDGLGLDD